MTNNKDIRRPSPKKTINNKILMVCCQIVKQSPQEPTMKGELWRVLYLHCSKQIIRKGYKAVQEYILYTYTHSTNKSWKWFLKTTWSISRRIGTTSNYRIYDFAIILPAYKHFTLPLSFQLCQPACIHFASSPEDYLGKDVEVCALREFVLFYLGVRGALSECVVDNYYTQLRIALN